MNVTAIPKGIRIEIPLTFASRVAESRAKRLSPAIGAVWVGPGRTLLRTLHGELPDTPAPHWHIGSCTKAMTATLFARLVDRGLLGFDMTLAEVLPELVDKIAPGFRNTSMRALLTHSAGVMRDPAQSTFRALRKSTAPISAQRRFLISHALKEAPQPKIGYSNIGYILVGAVIEKVTGLSWEDALARDVMQPLGISRFGFGGPGQDHPSGHRRVGVIWWPERQDNPEVYGPAGRVHLPLEDWGRFLDAHVRSSSFLSEGVRTTLHTPAENGYAMGWLPTEQNGERILLHTGSNTAWFSQATLLPDRGVGLGVVCNAYDARIEKAVGALSRELLEL